MTFKHKEIDDAWRMIFDRKCEEGEFQMDTPDNSDEDYSMYYDEEKIKAFISFLVSQFYEQGKREAIAEIKKVWEDEGINPEYHREQKVLLAKNWPLLYKAILNLIRL